MPRYLFTATYPVRTLGGEDAYLEVARETVAATWREALLQVDLLHQRLLRLEVRIEGEAETLHLTAEEIPT